jgi:hypothetical protein
MLPAASFAAIFPRCENNKAEGSCFAGDESARTVKRDSDQARIIVSLRMKVLIP